MQNTSKIHILCSPRSFENSRSVIIVEAKQKRNFSAYFQDFKEKNYIFLEKH